MSLPAEAIDCARQVDILPTAQRFVILKHVAANEWAGPCPSCGGDNRFAVNARKQVFNCRGCGARGGVIDLVMLALGIGFAQAVNELAGQTWTPTKMRDPTLTVLAAPMPKKLTDSTRRRAGCGAEESRWLALLRKGTSGRLAATEDPCRPRWASSGPTMRYPPALIAAFATHPGEVEPGVLAEPRNVQSVQLIALKPDGSGKADVEVKKRTIGGHKGVPIVVSPPNDGLGLSIHEGVEDALSAYEATNLGCWASGGAGFLPDLADAVPGYIECITIVSHRDDAGQIGASNLARRLTERGIEVFLKEDDSDG
jgi:hypothetical protein